MTDSSTARALPETGTHHSEAHKEVSAQSLVTQLKGLDSSQAARILTTTDPVIATQALRSLSPDFAYNIFQSCAPDVQKVLENHISPELLTQWRLNASFPGDSVGRLMDPPTALFSAETSVAQAIETLRELVKKEFITYAYIIDSQGQLEGLVVMRDLLFAKPDQSLGEIMLRSPFALKATTTVMDAMKEVLSRHFPVYPITEDRGRLIGLVRGYRLFEAQAVEISAQAGSMVGVEKEERLSTPWLKSFRYRHPWLQLNLLTAFIAGAVVNFFQGTIDQIVVLAAFLPVLAGQSGNTGCQALAVTLRGMTLGELNPTAVPKVLCKEALLGMLNGALVGLSAAAGMYFLASSQHHPQALILSSIVLTAMIGSCLVSGVSGALVPLVLRKVGADPATASSIFLTTATDVASMGLLLSLATKILL